LVVDTGKIDDDRVTLPNDLGFGDAERVNTITNSLNSQVEAYRIVFKSPMQAR
jgi:hypothetical protein